MRREGGQPAEDVLPVRGLQSGQGSGAAAAGAGISLFFSPAAVIKWRLPWTPQHHSENRLGEGLNPGFSYFTCQILHTAASSSPAPVSRAAATPLPPVILSPILFSTSLTGEREAAVSASRHRHGVHPSGDSFILRPAAPLETSSRLVGPSP